MCYAAIPYIIAAVGTGAAMVSQNQQTKYQTGLANQKAEQIRLQQQDALSRGATEEEQHLAKVAELKGRQRALMGASGAQVGAGSFGDILASTETQGRIDANMIRTNALREAWGLQSEAEMVRAQNEVNKSMGKWNQMNSVLTGASRAYGIYQDQHPDMWKK